MSRAFAILLASLLLCNPLGVCAKSKSANAGMAPGNAMSPSPSTNEEDDGSSKGKKGIPIPGLPLLGMGTAVGGAAGLGMLMRKGKKGKGGSAGAMPAMGPTGVYNPAGSGASTLNTMGGGQTFAGVSPFLSTTNPASLAASQVPLPAPQAPNVITNYTSGGDALSQTGNFPGGGGNQGNFSAGGNFPASSNPNIGSQFVNSGTAGMIGGGQFGSDCSGGQFDGGQFGGGQSGGGQFGGGQFSGSGGQFGGGQFGGGQFGGGQFGGGQFGGAQGRAGCNNGFKSRWWGQHGQQSDGCADGYREGWWGDHHDEPHAELYPDSM